MLCHSAALSLMTVAVASASALDSFRHVTSVCSTCTPARPSEGLRVQHGSAVDGGSLNNCASQCEAACVGFGFLPESGACELYRFSEQYEVAPDPEPWQYWLRNDTPGLAPAVVPAKRSVAALLAAPTANVALERGGRFARSMSISADYLLRNYEVDNLLWWFRDRAGLAQPNASASPQGWDRCVDNKRGGAGHLCLKGSVASTFLMGAGGHLRWPSDGASPELRRRFDAVLKGIEEATTPVGFAAAFAENETMYREVRVCVCLC